MGGTFKGPIEEMDSMREGQKRDGQREEVIKRVEKKGYRGRLDEESI